MREASAASAPSATLPAPAALTSQARSGSDSHPSRSTKAAELTTTSGRAAAICSTVRERSVMSISSMSQARTR